MRQRARSLVRYATTFWDLKRDIDPPREARKVHSRVHSAVGRHVAREPKRTVLPARGVTVHRRAARSPGRFPWGRSLVPPDPVVALPDPVQVDHAY